MKIINAFKDLTKFELFLWLSSLIIITASFFVARSDNFYTLIASLIGITALIFVAKGFILGQVLTVIFAVFYGIISVSFRYYGEMITYLGMTAPIAILAIISWSKNPYNNTAEVKVSKLTKKKIVIMFAMTAIITFGFYFILKSFNTANLIISTISVTTSFIASYLTFMRSPYYAIGYAINDIVLIVLWILASIDNFSYITMVICFIMFFINDAYGFVNWRRMQKRQSSIKISPLTNLY